MALTWLRRWIVPESQKSAPSASRMRLRVESLEGRDVPSAANDAFVAASFQALVHRAPDATATQAFGAALDNGTDRATAVAAIQQSSEYRSLQVQNAYQQILGRAPESSAVAGWLAAGVAVDPLRVALLGSDEFYARAGGTLDGYLNQLYSVGLGRGGDAGGLAAFRAQTDAGSTASRSQTAKGIVNSQEARTNEVTNLFQNVLGRMPDSGGLNSWLQNLANGVNITAVAAGFVGSDEFYQKAQGSGFSPNANISTQVGVGVTPILATNLTVDPAVVGDYVDDLSSAATGTPNRVFATVGAANGSVLLNPTQNGTTAGLLTGNGSWTGIRATTATNQTTGTVSSFFANANGQFRGPGGSVLSSVLVQVDGATDGTAQMSFFNLDGTLIDGTVIRIALVRR